MAWYGVLVFFYSRRVTFYLALYVCCGCRCVWSLIWLRWAWGSDVLFLFVSNFSSGFEKKGHGNSMHRWPYNSPYLNFIKINWNFLVDNCFLLKRYLDYARFSCQGYRILYGILSGHCCREKWRCCVVPAKGATWAIEVDCVMIRGFFPGGKGDRKQTWAFYCELVHPVPRLESWKWSPAK